MHVRAFSFLLIVGLTLGALGGETKMSTLAKTLPPKLRITQHGTGALLRDDFNANRWGPEWKLWVQDEALKVYCKDGELRVSGVSAKPVPVCADHHEFRFVGLVSKNFVQRDVVLACKMRVLTTLPKGNTRVRYLVHLCGAVPDYFVDAGLSHEPDGRDGWLFEPIADGYPFSHDHKGPRLSIKEIAPYTEHVIAIEHNAASKLTRGFIVNGDLWQSIGEHKLFLSTTQAELKVDVPYDGVRVDVAYDDARLYPRPGTAPVRFVLLKPPFPFFPFPQATVRFLDDKGNEIGKAQTNADGEVAINLPAKRLYPIGGKVEVTVKGKVIGVATIKAHGVDGLYPGDVWTIFAPDEFKVTDRGYPLGM